jgi:hypothetical protein
MLQRVLTIALMSSVLVAPLVAQRLDTLKVRVDRSTNAQDPDDTPDLKTVAMGKGVRVTGGPAGTFWNAADTATGNFTVKATFNLQQPSNHTNYYGLIFGGSNLDGPKQAYIYFVIAQNGTFQVRHRMGDQAMTVGSVSKHAAIATPDATGKSTNTLEVRVAGNMISYVVNNQVVHTTPKSGMTAATDGIVGFRVNHMMDVQVEGFQLTKG